MVDIQAAFEEHLYAIGSLRELAPELEAVAKRMVDAIRSGGKILWMGNGGSAADSQHLAAELVGRYNRERKGLPSIALTTDPSILTAVSNDYGFDAIFARQIEALASNRDVVVGISTSGRSQNVLNGIKKAREIGAYTVAFAGKDGGQLAKAVDIALVVPSQTTSRIQEGHILLGHILCDWIEAAFTE